MRLPPTLTLEGPHRPRGYDLRGCEHCQVPAPWQAGLSNGANVGEIIGLFINGWVSERFGYRYTVMTCLSLIIAFTAIFFTAQSVVALQVAEILCGIP